MTARRASFLGLVGLVFAFWTTVVSCNLDTSGYGETEDVCTADAHCDDGNVCTEDTCGPNGVCVHAPAPDGLLPDGAQGNCKVIQCSGGVQSVVPSDEDVDDGNACTEDACQDGTATHTVTMGAPCQIFGGQSTCNAQGECEPPACGHVGADGAEVTCPDEPGDCTTTHCDKAKGRCVEVKLDGVPVPGGPAVTECGGSYCADGVEEQQLAPAGSPCTLAGSSTGEPGMCHQGACVECIDKEDCSIGLPESKCHSYACEAGECKRTTQRNGSLAGQPVGDCLDETCSDGVYIPLPDDDDVIVDGNDCTDDLCVNGQPVNPPSKLNAPCGAGGLLYCNGRGTCAGCTESDQCGNGTECRTPVCNTDVGECGFSYVAAGTVIMAQMPGDCAQVVCDGNGEMMSLYLMSDPFDDGNDCTVDECQALNMTKHTPVSAGTLCDDGGGKVCDGATHCVGAPCPQTQCPSGTFCVDGVCCESQCNGICNACSVANKMGGSDGLCEPIVMGDPDGDCPGNSACAAGACQPLPLGAMCVGAPQECASGNCVDGRCCNNACGGTCQACNVTGSLGTCTNVPANTDPANECPNGACSMGGCKLDNGQTCSANSQCLSGNCVDGVCCNSACGATCQACNVTGSVGMCTNVPAGMDPANECPNGACSMGGCKLDNGQTCSASSQCLSGNCVDGVCCNSACGATCQACNVAGSVGTCTNVPAGMDPANECPNGACSMGGCKSDNGQTCSTGTQCLSGFCADGRCCNSACGGTCESCNQAGSQGTCTPFANGTDPSNECAGATNCNGMSGCTKLPQGTACTQGAECASNFCVDNVCCGSVCNGPCEACNLGPSIGTCTFVAAGQDPSGECPGADACNGAGACKKGNGGTCVVGSDCASGHCADGVCCNVACNGTCEACDLGGSVGTCTDIPANTDPDAECAGAQVCSIMGTCVGGPDGAGCAAANECGSGFCVDNVCCNMACSGLCEACSASKKGSGSDGVCGAIVNSDPDGECGGAQVCSGGACVGGPNGVGCLAGSECATGHCVDGVCCDDECAGTCMACSIFKKGGGANGVCGNILAGDPDDECPDAAVCDGMGDCTD